MTTCMLRGRPVFIPFLAIIFALVILSQIAIAFQTSEVTLPGDSGTDRSPRMAVADDILVVAWLNFDGPDIDIMYRVRHQGSWSGIGKIVESSGNERDLALCSSGGRIYAAWATDASQYVAGPDWDIALSVYDHGTGWSEPVELTALSDTADDYAPFLLPSQNGVIALWHSFEGGDGLILMSEFTGTVSGPVTVTDDWKGLNQNPAAAFLDNMLWIVWSSSDNRYTDGVDLDLVAAPFHVQNGSLGTVMQLSNATDTEDDLYPSILESDGRLYVAWQSNDKTVGPGDDVDIGLATYDGEWSTNALTSPHDTGDDTYPSLFALNDRIWIAWQSSDPSTTGNYHWDIVVAEIEDGALGSVFVVSEGKEPVDEGGVLVRGHDAVQVGQDIEVIWETTNSITTDGADSDIVLAVLAQPGEEKPDGDVGGSIGMVPIIVVTVFVVCLAAFLKFRRPGNDEKRPKRKRRTRN